MKTLFNDNWQFKMEHEDEWRAVSVPHDWLIADTRNLYKSGVGCYKKRIDGDAVKPGQRLWLEFDGVYMDSTLYVNGQRAGEWKYGYTAFAHELTPFMRPGGNELMLTVRYASPNSRWYTGAGIFRDCRLIVKNAAHFVRDGIYITPRPAQNGCWRVHIDAEVEFSSLNTDNNQCRRPQGPGCAAEYTIRHSLKDCSEEYETLPDGGIRIQNPRLWDIEAPFCYTLISELIVDGQTADREETRFGFRHIEFTPDDGFRLNGRRVEVYGVCQHHDLGALGAAVHKDALRRQLMLLREMGVNAIRTAHNPPAAALMELTDEMGFLVQSELTDIWTLPKNSNDYARFFDEWVEKDAAAWLRRDRNCPSVIMWSLGNEIYDTHADAVKGAATLRRLMDLVQLHDPNGHAPATLCSNYMPWENTQNCADIIKLIGYNYAEYLYHDHHAAHPDWMIYGGETASTVQSRGVYHFPFKKSLLGDDDLQCSSLGNSTTSWGAKSPEACIIDHRDAPFSLGQFLWSGFDYIGEPTPYHTKNSYFGQLDTAGFPKDSFYIYKSAWTDKPMLHLFPHWDWSPGQPVDVRIASNAPKVELFVNGRSIGAQDIDRRNGTKLTADYIVPYEPGCIKAVAYDEGKIVAETARYSFGDAVTLELTHTNIGELIFTEIIAADAEGRPVENAANRVIVEVTDGELLGLDNGDSTDYDQYVPESKHRHSRRLFSGKMLAISKGGKVTAKLDEADIPVRKIELTRDGLTITAKIYPANATSRRLHWRLANSAGIDSPLGKLTAAEDGLSALLAPIGDGEVYVRCAAEKTPGQIGLISLLPITLSGYGKPCLDPYAFVSGGLYTLSNVPMTNGNERGVATLRDGESHVGFTDLDFGPVGSDTVTLWLFPLLKEPFPFEIWQGMPENGRHLCTLTYDKGSVWNTYQEVTYKLPQKLTGIQNLCLVFRQKVHVKGFQFTPIAKAFERIHFADNDRIYGDSFQVIGQAVENIGNNVTITFSDLNFDTAATSIELCWRSSREVSTIKMLLTDSCGNEHINLLTLPGQESYSSAVFPLDTPLSGKGELHFIFLPGTALDLEWFRMKH